MYLKIWLLFLSSTHFLKPAMFVRQPISNGPRIFFLIITKRERANKAYPFVT